MTKPVDAILARLTALHPKRIDLSLDRVQRLLAALDHPERKLPPVIHVAGTNGKGSTIAFMRAILEAAGKRVHAYTSPHLVRFNERYRLGAQGEGRLVSDDELSAALEECERANAGAPITVFEITTAVGMLLFARHPADVLLMEVGLGGRLDATNVVDNPLATIITRVAIDHTDFLGDTLDKIAAEKAGILKHGTPAIIAAQARDALSAIERQAAKIGAPLKIAGEDWTATEERGRLVYQDDAGLLDLPAPKLYGRHQFENAGLAIAALRAIKPFKIAPVAYETGMVKADWPARLHRLAQGRLVDLAPTGSELWLDGGHNPDGGTGDRGRARRSRRARLAPFGADRRHAGEQRLRGLPEQFYRTGAAHDRGAGAGRRKRSERGSRRRCRARHWAGCNQPRQSRGSTGCRAQTRSRSAAADFDHRLALSGRRSSARKRHATDLK